MANTAVSLPRLGIVLPCYNEECVLPSTLLTLSHLIKELIADNLIHEKSFIYCVDDGSQDQTWQIIFDHYSQQSCIKGLRLGRNAGHQNALLAGLLNIKDQVDCAITLDADLQDDINAIKTMLTHFREGSDIVYGVRQAREHDSYFKRLTAFAFYKLMQRAGSKLIYNHADFRLLSQRTIDQLAQFPERNIFLRGIFTLIGFKTSEVYYDRKNRFLGVTKYPLKKMLSLAWDGIISFSHIPLDFILMAGILAFVTSILMTTWVIYSKLMGHTVPGWTSLMVPICFLGGVQLLSLGILGEYLAKIYLEVKRRPRYIKDTELI